jgi:hypothetical protein
MNPFIQNKYTKWYFSIIDSAQLSNISGYTERHHIIPKSIGGSNDKTNIVKLTPKQHFICHRLLVKMTEGKTRQKMVYAFWIMSNKKRLHLVTSNSYSSAKNLIQEIMSNRIISDEFRQKCRTRQLGKKMLPQTQEALLKANLGKSLNTESKEKIRKSVKNWYENNKNTRIGEKRTEEQKKRMSEARKLSWQKNPFQGRSKSQ